MLFVRYLLASLLIILLAVACSPEPKELAPDGDIFGFSVDPQGQTVTLNVSETALPRQVSSEPRILTTSELTISSFDFRFLPGNTVRIEASFANATGFDAEPKAFSQLSFRRTSKILPYTAYPVSSVEPTVTDDDLGGDGVLSPGEASKPLVFEVVHDNRTFSYFVEARAVVAPASAPETVCATPDERVYFPDDTLQRIIEDALGKTNLTCADMEMLEELELRSTRVQTIAGLQTAKNLRKLSFERLYSLGEVVVDTSVIGELTNLRELNIVAAFNTLEGLRTLTNLEKLRLTGNLVGERGLGDLSALGNLINLQELRLPNAGLFGEDLTGLKGLANLRILDLEANNLGDLSSIANLTSLQELYLSRNQVSDISPLANLTNLTKLDFYDNKVSDVSPLANLTNLTLLALTDNPLVDIQALSNLTEMTQLYLQNVLTEDITPLGNMTKLTELYLRSPFKSPEPVNNLTKLKILYLTSSQVTELSLRDLTALETLAINSDQLTSVSLTNLTSLPIFSLNGEQLTSFTADNLTSLTTLIMVDFDRSRRQLTNLTLNDLPNLSDLRLGFNRLTDISTLSDLPSLVNLELNYNRISDISPLVANPNIGDGDDLINLGSNCLDLSEGSDDLANIQIIENRNPDKVNIPYFSQSESYQDRNCTP